MTSVQMKVLWLMQLNFYQKIIFLKTHTHTHTHTHTQRKTFIAVSKDSKTSVSSDTESNSQLQTPLDGKIPNLGEVPLQNVREHKRCRIACCKAEFLILNNFVLRQSSDKNKKISKVFLSTENQRNRKKKEKKNQNQAKKINFSL